MRKVLTRLWGINFQFVLTQYANKVRFRSNSVCGNIYKTSFSLISELNSQVNDLRGKFVKPTLKKVSKYENKFAKLQKKAAEFNFRNQLKVVKKKEFTLEEEDKEKKTRLVQKGRRKEGKRRSRIRSIIPRAKLSFVICIPTMDCIFLPSFIYFHLFYVHSTPACNRYGEGEEGDGTEDDKTDDGLTTEGESVADDLTDATEQHSDNELIEPEPVVEPEPEPQPPSPAPEELWAYLKDTVCSNNPLSVDDLVDKLMTAVTAIPQPLLNSVVKDTIKKQKSIDEGIEGGPPAEGDSTAPTDPATDAAPAVDAPATDAPAVDAPAVDPAAPAADPAAPGAEVPAVDPAAPAADAPVAEALPAADITTAAPLANDEQPAVATAGEAVPAEATPSADATTPEVAVPPAESEPEPATD
ncbi:tropomyosin-1, isoforms 33/34-like [Sipha flava]|uniref:Tropomyosin-1, isoforms 33/34-like n=2 Tax=Sipha flava TaxID=143950 RepID=A0A8B8G6U8_9HEMI|nr:tropomyosin-1, isoforms 33/34-like [Sipha flava]